MNKLIAISGTKGSGKDLTAKMIQYCLSVPKLFRQYWIYKYFRNLFFKSWKIIAFADPLKKVLSVLLNIPVEKFSDRNFKENFYVDFNTLTCSDALNNPLKLSDTKFNKMAKALDLDITRFDLTIRQLMQYFGTNIALTYLGKNIWINSTLKNASKKTIISDLRFLSEAEKVRSLNGKIIYIDRPGYTFGNHQSE